MIFKFRIFLSVKNENSKKLFHTENLSCTRIFQTCEKSLCSLRAASLHLLEIFSELNHISLAAEYS
jgi:hypothetical protein